MKLHAFLMTVLVALNAFSLEMSYVLDQRGLPIIKADGKTIFSGHFVGWGAGWSWANVSSSKSGDVYDISVEKLKTTGSLSWNSADSSMPEAVFQFVSEETLDPVIGIGVEFRLAFNDEMFKGASKEPVINMNSKSVSWTIADNKSISLNFSQNVDTIYFERGNKGIIRVMFFSEKIPEGEKEITMALSLPEGTGREKSLSELYGSPDYQSWNKNAMLPDVSFVDLSFLNHKPAGKYGFVKTQGDALVINGRPIRFWGCNIQAYSLFINDKEMIEKQAKRIAALGYNLVRLHHHDSKRWVKKCLISDGETSQELDKEALDTYFYWIKCLKEQGIYIWVDLHVGRPFTPGDNIPYFDELKGGLGNKEAKFYCYLNDRIKELMKEFQKKLLTTVNPYTGKSLAKDPAVMGFLITNENDITNHGGNAFLADKNVPAYHEIFKKKVEAFSQKTGLPKNKLMETWLPGDSKLLLNDMEYAWSKEMVEHVRSLGVQVPIAAGHMWGNNPIFSLPALTAGSIIDSHCYDNGEFLKRNPRNSATMGENILYAQLCDFPFSITEWNAEDGAKSKDTFTHSLYIAALASFQGWDAPMLYGYSQDAFNNRDLSCWSSYNVPAIMGLSPAAALIYRRMDVSPAKEQYVLKYDIQNLIYETTRTTPALRTLSMLHGVAAALPAIPQLSWLKPTKIPYNAKVVTDLNKSFIPEGQDYIISDTGELYRNWKMGIFIINTQRSKGFTGWTQDKPIMAGSASFDIQNPKVAVIISSLDGKPIERSSKMLLTAVARNVKINNDIFSEPVKGTVSIKHFIPGLKISPVNGDGSLQEPIPLKKSAGKYNFKIPEDKNTHWFVISR